MRLKALIFARVREGKREIEGKKNKKKRKKTLFKYERVLDHKKKEKCCYEREQILHFLKLGGEEFYCKLKIVSCV